MLRICVLMVRIMQLPEVSRFHFFANRNRTGTSQCDLSRTGTNRNRNQLPWSLTPSRAMMASSLMAKQKKIHNCGDLNHCLWYYIIINVTIHGIMHGSNEQCQLSMLDSFCMLPCIVCILSKWNSSCNMWRFHISRTGTEPEPPETPWTGTNRNQTGPVSPLAAS